MSTEGHNCWEDCDEGPHGCVCGNDCAPPRWMTEQDEREALAQRYCPVHGDLLAGTRSPRCSEAPKGHELPAAVVPAVEEFFRERFAAEPSDTDEREVTAALDSWYSEALKGAHDQLRADVYEPARDRMRAALNAARTVQP